MGFYSSVLTFTFITSLIVVGLYILTGLTGMFSLGQAAFMGVGAYTASLLMLRLNAPFLVSMLAAIVLSVGIGYLIGFPIIRLRRDYLTLITLCFGEAIVSLLNGAKSITGGSMGLIGIPQHTNLLVVTVALLISIILAINFRVSKFGRMAIAVKSDEMAAKAMGINIWHVKMRSFLISVAFTAMAGVFYASYTRYIDPTLFGWRISAEWLVMVFFGGVNSLTGSMLSTIFLTALPEVIRFTGEYRMVVYSILVLIVINFKPDGLLGNWELTDLFVKSRRKSRSKKEDMDGHIGD